MKESLFSRTTNFGLNPLLMAALAAGNRGLVKAVLALEPELKSSYSVSAALNAAAQGGDLENLKALLAAGATLEPKPRDPLNETATSALLEAVRYNRRELVAWLLENGADPNAVGGRNADRGGSETPLSLAIANGHSVLAELLIAKGAKVNPPLQYAASPLAAALGIGDFALAQMLLEEGAYLQHSEPLLFDAALRGNLASLEKYKDTLGEENREGETVFHYAALFGTPATLDWLLQNGARSSVASKRGQTPLHWAVRANNRTAAEWFLKNGASATATDSNGQTPLHLAAFRGSSTLVTLLLEKGAAPNAAIPNGPHGESAYGRGVTPLHRAVLYGNSPVVTALLKAKADPNALTEGKMTPLHFAARGGQSEAAKILLQNGADAKIGTPVLLVAAREYRFNSPWSHPLPRPFPTPDHAATATVLLAGGADASATDSRGQTALMLAVTPPAVEMGESKSAARRLQERQETGTGRAKLIAALVKGGVPVNARARADSSEFEVSGFYEGVPGPTALHRAVEHLDVAGVQALLENGADPALEDPVGRTAMDYALRRGENSPQRWDVPFANARSRGFADYEKTAPGLLDGSARREIIALLRKHGGDKIGRGPFFNALAWGAVGWVKNAVNSQPTLARAVASYDSSNGPRVFLHDKVDEVGTTVPRLAISTRQFDLARFLIEKGAPIGATGWNKTNLLFDAAWAKEWSLVDWLMQKGLKWEAETSQGRTPLHFAAQLGDLESVKELVKRGVPLNTKDKNGHTALTVAQWDRRTSVVEFLREQGGTE